MHQRLHFPSLSQEQTQKLVELSQTAAKGSLTKTELELVNLRASQLNGCAFCVDLDVKKARANGERELRLHHVAVWRESPLFTEKERAILEWTEVVTKLNDHGVSDLAYERARNYLSEKEISDLTFVIGAINVWNRLNASFRTTPGSMDKMFGLENTSLK